MLRQAAALLALVAAGCGPGLDETPWCSDTAPAPAPVTETLSYFRDVGPILAAKCARCHTDGGIGPFPLTTFDEAFAMRVGVRETVADRHMPPWLAAGCCNRYFHDQSLTDAEIATITGWVDQGAPPGNPDDAPEPQPPVGGLSRVDYVAEMPEEYTPAPPAGSTDDQRCFLLDWPFDGPVYVTGLNPVPGAREVVHHLIVAVVNADGVGDLEALEAADDRPGFDCGGGVGDIDLRDIQVLGGSMAGGDFPRGIGTLVEPGGKVVLNVHYSTIKGQVPDRTKVEFRVDESATSAKGIALANPAWLVDDAMGIPAGEKDAVFYFWLEPDLFTRDKNVRIQGISPHMHHFGSKMVVRIKHADDSRTCLLEIPHWHMGWQQPFWLDETVLLGDDDELYIECHFDNSAEHQPDGQPPRDIAWGDGNQDMCAAFLSFTEAE